MKVRADLFSQYFVPNWNVEQGQLILDSDQLHAPAQSLSRQFGRLVPERFRARFRKPSSYSRMTAAASATHGSLRSHRALPGEENGQLLIDAFGRNCRAGQIQTV